MYMAVEIPQETYDSIFEDIAHSSKSLEKICDSHGVSYRTFYRRINDDDELCQRYARAKKEQADRLVEEIIEISDNTSEDYIDVNVGTEEEPVIVSKVDQEHINRSRLRVDARKWAASKLNSKKYGDKIEHSGGLDVVTKVITEVVDPAKSAESDAES